MPSAARSPPSLKLRLSNEDATCRLGLRGAAAPDPRQVSVRTLRAVQIGRNQCSVCPKQVYDIGRNHCTNATVLRVRHSPKRLFVFTRFAQQRWSGWFRALGPRRVRGCSRGLRTARDGRSGGRSVLRRCLSITISRERAGKPARQGARRCDHRAAPPFFIT
jgi:hypothetical protein